MRNLHVEVVGGGPGGLFLARLLRLTDPSATVRVHERRGPDDAFGFGVVFSDRTMSALRAADPVTCDLIRDASVSWSGMEMRLPARTLSYDGYGFTSIARRKLLRVLRSQAELAGAELVFHDERVPEPPEAGGDHVLVLADGVNSANRARLADRFGTTVETGAARYLWLATRAPFTSIVFPFVPTPLGAFGAHAYPYGDGMSTFIVEVDEQTWRRYGMDRTTEDARAVGGSDERSRALLQDVFAEHLLGHELVADRSRWDTFRVVRNERWWSGNTVLLGDAAHTAHFSVGSGTKLAMEDAIALAGELRRADEPAAAFAAYQATRRPMVARTQRLATRSMHWWETFGRRMGMPAHRFGAHFLTRTDAIDYAGLRRRHPERIAEAEAEFAAEFAATAGGQPAERPAHALDTPVALGGLRLPNRVAVPLPAGAAPEQAVAAVSVAGAALVLADLRNTGPGWDAVPAQVAEHGGALGVVLTPDQCHGALPPAQLFEVVVDRAADLPAVATLLDRAGDAVVLAGLACPRRSARDADELLGRCAALGERGVAGVHLRDQGTGWEHLLAWADRIRTETGVPVLLDGPSGWALRVRGEPGDDWPTRLHLALVSGRADLVVAWPLTVPGTGTTRRPALRTA